MRCGTPWRLGCGQGITLVAGQTLLERVFGLGTSLSVIIEFVGGSLFIYLLLKGMVR